MIMSESPSKTQVGGSHYKDMVIQPFHFAMVNNFNAFQFAVVKYASRYLNKNGVQDLKKIIHFCELEIERLDSMKEELILSGKFEEFMKTQEAKPTE